MKIFVVCLGGFDFVLLVYIVVCDYDLIWLVLFDYGQCYCKEFDFVVEVVIWLGVLYYLIDMCGIGVVLIGLVLIDDLEVLDGYYVEEIMCIIVVLNCNVIMLIVVFGIVVVNGCVVVVMVVYGGDYFIYFDC